ncbi:hypothetical protein KAR91_61975 [Candidatus Pacearchaeota archaeon]|nr:hypothetical protein [Candidatus Pacearchaeota archaeon]
MAKVKIVRDDRTWRVRVFITNSKCPHLDSVWNVDHVLHSCRVLSHTVKGHKQCKLEDCPRHGAS